MLMRIFYEDTETNEVNFRDFVDEYRGFGFAAEIVAFDDIYPREFLYGIVLNELTELKKFRYVGWQPGMKIEFRYEDGKEAFVGRYPEWDH